MRARVALVLSGGGARGFAHIGVLRALGEMQIPVDMVIGTSMGSVIGGAYAAGASLGDMELMARETDWDRVVADRPARQDLEFRRREEDVLLPSRLEFGVHRDGLSLPPSAAGNQALEQALGRLLPAGTRDVPVNLLALPFRSVASDLVTGEMVDLIDTPLFLTMRASLAVPGVFAPVRVNGRLVVDGGLVRNLPVDLAHKMGADVVIAVNVGTPLAPEKHLGSALGVAQQMINILTEQNVQRSLRDLRAHDILIAPELAGVSFLDFRNIGMAIQAGETATRALAPQLAALALSSEAYALFEKTRLATPPLLDKTLPIVHLDVTSDGVVNPRALEVQSGLAPGQRLNKEQIRRAADALYGRGDLERVETDIDDTLGQRSVRITATEAPWANSRLRVGLEIASDFDDDNSFGLKLMHVKSSINRWGGELRSMTEIGSARQLGTQFFQPLGAGSQWYIAPSLGYGSSSLDQFTDGRRVLRYAQGEYSAQLVFGRELGTWGDIQAGITRYCVGGELLIPQQPLPVTEKQYGLTRFLRYRVDTLDSLGFPSRGNLLEMQLDYTTVDAPESGTNTRIALLGMTAFGFRDWAGHLYGEYATGRGITAPSQLGGFLRLSGTAQDSIQGGNVAFMRMVMARKIGALPVTLGGTVRAGFSVEAGGGFNPAAPVAGDRFKQAASAFVSVDTRFGPAFVGAGATRDGSKKLYLFLGPVW